jgi:FKBP-type peptidyl-prolyl cis-trans isomerase FkpA
MLLRACLSALAVLTLAACEENVMQGIDRMRADRRAAAEAVAQKSKAFLAENAQKADVKTTESGLQYRVVRAVSPDTPRPTPADRVRVNYEGKLVDGSTFDSSYARGQPIDFGVTEVIPGWTEGLQLMRPGEEFMFYVPAEIGYGAAGGGEEIPPNAALIFKVELLSFQRPDGSVVAPR